MKDTTKSILVGIGFGAVIGAVTTGLIVGAAGATITVSETSETAPSPTSSSKASESTPLVILPDSPEIGSTAPQQPAAWDCRLHGNQMCGIQIESDWYLVQFFNGQPVSVVPRG